MDYLEGVIVKYSNKGIILDTNLLILFVVGNFNLNLIETFGRTKSRGYLKEDFIFLINLLRKFKHIYLTPHILTELSNMTFEKINKKNFTEYLSSVVNSIKDKKEYYISKDILATTACLKFGFADSSIFELAKKENLPVLTDDYKLSGFLAKNKIDCININHLKNWGIARK